MIDLSAFFAPSVTANEGRGSVRVRGLYRSLLTSRFSVMAEDGGGHANVSAAPNDSLPAASKGKVVVGGGTGFVGTEVCSLLKRKGYRVVVISRQKSSSADDRMTWEELASNGLPEDTKAVVNVAGHNILDKFRRWNDNFKTIVYDSRIMPARMLKTAIEKSPEEKAPDAFVQITGAGYYPFDKDDVIAEDYKFDADKEGTYFTSLVRDWESAATLRPGHPTRNVFLRAGVVLGANGGLIKETFLPFFVGLGGRMGSGTQFMPWIHVKDVAGLILHSIENPEVKGVVNGTAPEIITNQQFVEAFASALARPAFIPLPEMAFNLIFGPERAAIVLRGQKVTPKKALDTGYQYRFPTIASACKEFDSLFYMDPDTVA